MALIICPDCQKEFSDAAVACPNCARPNARPVATGGGSGVGRVVLVAALLGVLVWAVGGVGSDTAPAVGTSSAQVSDYAPPIVAAPQLELTSLTWQQEYDYAIVQGRVTNISSTPMENVTAVASFTDRSGNDITSDDALVDYQPIMPGQSSPFKVMARWNPAMKNASIDFRELMGGSIAWRRKPKALSSPSSGASSRKSPRPSVPDGPEPPFMTVSGDGHYYDRLCSVAQRLAETSKPTLFATAAAAEARGLQRSPQVGC